MKHLNFNSFWNLSLGLLMAIPPVVADYYVKQSAFFSTPHMKMENVEKAYTCAITCTSVPDCYGFTHEESTTICYLFYDQAPHVYQSQANANMTVQFVKVKKMMKDCGDLPPDKPSGIYRIYPSVSVYCEMTDAGGGWTVLQRRQDGSEDFFRHWADYKTGFGDIENEFWLGNDIIHSITSQKEYKVRFDLGGFDGGTVFAEYQIFYVDNESMDYALTIFDYSGTAGDGFFQVQFQNGVPFSATDVDNDVSTDICAADVKESGWWFRKCSNVNINGMYKQGVSDHTTVHWMPWRKKQSLSKTRMMIKPR